MQPGSPSSTAAAIRNDPEPTLRHTLGGMRAANLALRFVLELCALAAVAWWGWTVNVALGVALPLAVVVVWGAFISPKARFQVPQAVWYGLQAIIFGAAALALAAVWSTAAGIVFALVVAANLGLLAIVDR